MSIVNPKVAAIGQSTKQSYDKLNALLDGPISKLHAEKLYQRPTENAWTLMETLAHIAEMVPYWSDEIAKLVEQPGQQFGRTVENEVRLTAVREHGRDSLAHMRAALSGSYAHFDMVLSQLNDSDLQRTGQHFSRGEQTLEWFFEEFIVKHLREHVEQIQESLARVG
jgi:uncharacterized damage-inducible protein DinB